MPRFDVTVLERVVEYTVVRVEAPTAAEAEAQAVQQVVDGQHVLDRGFLQVEKRWVDNSARLIEEV